MINHQYISSPLGWISISTAGQKILKLNIQQDQPNLDKSNDDFLLFCIDQVNSYIKGELSKFSIPFDLPGTKFEQQVYREVCSVPGGQLKSYQDIAQKLGNVNLARAVGSANRKNPLLLVIPCHRIINKNGSIGGYRGGKWRKQWLIEHEQKIRVS